MLNHEKSSCRAPLESARTLAETAIALQPLESYLNNEFKVEGLSVRTTIGQSRRGAVNQPNQYTITFEIVPKINEKTTQDIISSNQNLYPNK